MREMRLWEHYLNININNVQQTSGLCLPLIFWDFFHASVFFVVGDLNHPQSNNRSRRTWGVRQRCNGKTTQRGRARGTLSLPCSLQAQHIHIFGSVPQGYMESNVILPYLPLSLAQIFVTGATCTMADACFFPHLAYAVRLNRALLFLLFFTVFFIL